MKYLLSALILVACSSIDREPWAVVEDCDPVVPPTRHHDIEPVEIDYPQIQYAHPDAGLDPEDYTSVRNDVVECQFD